MASCLGLYIQDNLIKYAKVTKDKDNLKVENFGVKFYDDIHEAINQIVSETFSYKTPIATNLLNETYNYFYMFSLLSKNDLKKSIDTEFESFCFDKGFNKNTLDTRYALVPDLEDKQKIKVIHISDNKLDVSKRLQQLEKQNVNTLVSLPMAITNIVDAKENENSLIVNIEDKTTITTIIDQKIYNVDILESGISEILNTISERENSYSKAYEICKNTTIYTMEGRELQSSENEYLQEIMPALYNIVETLQEKIANSEQKFQKIYISGTGAIINNIDLYFQEYFTESRVEILRPYFIPETVMVNMKDYIEVNSAIALGLQGLGNGVKNINFKNPSLAERLPDWMKISVGGKNKANTGKSGIFDKLTQKINLKTDMNGALDNSERWLVRSIAGILSFVIIYTIVSSVITGAINSKKQQTDELKDYTQQQISLVEQDITSIENRATEYKDLLESIQKFKDENNETKKWRDSIPNFLTELMYAVPKGVSIKSIVNTNGYTIRIVAKAKLYSQLAYLIGSIKTGGILYDVTSSSGEKSGDYITVVIEGNLFDN